MGWLRLVGSLKLQVSFAEYSLFSRALFQMRPIILRSLRIVATPYSLPLPLLLATAFEKKLSFYLFQPQEETFFPLSLALTHRRGSTDED